MVDIDGNADILPAEGAVDFAIAHDDGNPSAARIHVEPEGDLPVNHASKWEPKAKVGPGRAPCCTDPFRSRGFPKTDCLLEMGVTPTRAQKHCCLKKMINYVTPLTENS